MLTLPGVPVVLMALAVIFVGAALQTFLREEGKLTIERKVWLRIAFVFSGVAIGLFLWQTFVV